MDAISPTSSESVARMFPAGSLPDPVAMTAPSVQAPAQPSARDRIIGTEFGAGYFLTRDSSKRSLKTWRIRKDIGSALGAKLEGLRRIEEFQEPLVPFLTIFCAYLHRINGERNLRVGVAVAPGRGGAESWPAPMPIHLEFDEEETFLSLARKIAGELEWGRKYTGSFPHNPVNDKLYDAVYRHTEQNPATGAGRVPDGFAFPADSHETLLLQTIRHSGAGGFNLGLSLNAEAFDQEQSSRTLEHLLNLAEGLCQDPSSPLDKCPMLSQSERRRVLQQFNNTYYPHPRDSALHSIIEAQVRKTPSATALVFGGETLSYAEMNAKANRLAHRLRAEGVGPDICVGVSCERSLEMPLALLSVLKAGGAYVPLDPAYPKDRLATMVMDAGITIVLAETDKFHLFPAGTRFIALDSFWDRSPVEDAGDPEVAVGPEHLAYVIYTSGSTGKPKGAMNTHGAICNRLYWMQYELELGASDRVLQKTPYSFDVSVWEFFWPLMFGAGLVIARPDGHRDGKYLARLVKEAGITILHFVPSMLSLFLEDIEPGSLPCIRKIVCSGEALSHDLMQRTFKKIDARLYNLYGPTEAAVDVTCWECRPEYPRSIVPIGRPIHNVQMYVLDKHLNPMPIGVPGEIYIGGDGVGKGYINNSELTRERFIRDPYQIGDWRLYKTSDLGRFLEDGNLEYLGRLDFQVKLRGFRIELNEVQHVLLQHAAVREAAVVVREDQDGDKRLVAYVVASAESVFEKKSIIAFLESRLPQYMVPYNLVRLQSLPLSSNGKVDIKSLPAPAAAEGEGANRPIQPPRDGVEAMLVRIWENSLDVRPISVTDNYFHLGGYSLLAVSMFDVINRDFGTDLSVELLFRGAARLDQMAEAIRVATGASLEAGQGAATHG